MAHRNMLDRLLSPESRKELWPMSRTYWCVFANRQRIGYMRRQKYGVWYAQLALQGGREVRGRIGNADDDEPADGKLILSFPQALELAEKWCADAGASSPYPENETTDPEFPELPTAPPYLIGHALKSYLEWYRDNRQDYKRTYNIARASLFPALWTKPLQDLTNVDMRRWMFQQSNSPVMLRADRNGHRSYLPKRSADKDFIRRRRTTVNRKLHILRSALNHGLELGMIDTDVAWDSVRTFRRTARTRNQFLELDQLAELLSHCEPDLARLVSAAVMTGCRYGELRRLTVGDFDRGTGTLQVGGSSARAARTIQLTSEARELFSELSESREPGAPMLLRKDGTSWRSSSHHRPFKDACARAGLPPDFRFQDLRNTFAAHAIMSRVPIEAVAALLGHADTRTVHKVYGRLGNDYVAHEIDARMPTLLK